MDNPTQQTSLHIALFGFAAFIAGMIVYLTTKPVSSISGILFTLATLVMLAAIIILAFSYTG